MFVEIIIFSITAIAAYAVYSQKRLENHFKSRDVRMIPGWPMFGNFIKSSFNMKHFLDDLDDIYKAFPEEKYVGVLESTKPILLIRDPELIKQITVKDFDHFVDRRVFLTKEQDPLIGSTLLILKGKKWRDIRTTLSPAFTVSKMRQMIPFMTDISENIVDYLKEEIKNSPNGKISEQVHIDDLIKRYMNDMTLSSVFGLQVNSVKDKLNKFYQSALNLCNFTPWRRFCIAIMFVVPKLAKILGIRFFPKKTTDFFTNIIIRTMEHREKNMIERPDLIQILMESAKGFTKTELVSQAFTFYFGGIEPTATTLVMMIHELALHPDVQEKLYQEAKDTHDSNREMSHDLVQSLKYMDMVMNETLRKWSPVMILDRECTKPYILPPAHPGGKPCKVEPGDIVYNPVNSIHMDEKYYPEPDRFDPERFSDENKKNIKPFTFIPFGDGPRNCIGARFALLTMKILLYNLILNFEIRKCSRTTEPIRIQPMDISIKAVGETWVSMKAR